MADVLFFPLSFCVLVCIFKLDFSLILWFNNLSNGPHGWFGVERVTQVVEYSINTALEQRVLQLTLPITKTSALL